MEKQLLVLALVVATTTGHGLKRNQLQYLQLQTPSAMETNFINFTWTSDPNNPTVTYLQSCVESGITPQQVAGSEATFVLPDNEKNIVGIVQTTNCYSFNMTGETVSSDSKEYTVYVYDASDLSVLLSAAAVFAMTIQADTFKTTKINDHLYRTTGSLPLTPDLRTLCLESHLPQNNICYTTSTKDIQDGEFCEKVPAEFHNGVTGSVKVCQKGIKIDPNVVVSSGTLEVSSLTYPDNHHSDPDAKLAVELSSKTSSIEAVVKLSGKDQVVYNCPSITSCTLNDYEEKNSNNSITAVGLTSDVPKIEGSKFFTDPALNLVECDEEECQFDIINVVDAGNYIATLTDPVSGNTISSTIADCSVVPIDSVCFFRLLTTTVTMSQDLLVDVRQDVPTASYRVYKSFYFNK